MSFTGKLKRLFGGDESDKGHGMDELARRLGLSVAELDAVTVGYREFTIPKRSGGTRKILAPEPKLKEVQRRILHRLLGRLKCHWAATGFNRGHSIATNAVCHAGKAVVVRLDVKDFFASTTARRVHAYFRAIGWNKQAADTLVRLCMHDGALPQGAPTSPRLSNLVNYRLDVRMAKLAEKYEGVYTRYADDIAFSFAREDHANANTVIHIVRRILDDFGYELHLRKKLQIRRRHNRQLVTGLVVNERVNLPRATRRWLRAVGHHLATGRLATLTPAQLNGWNSLRKMIAKQSGAASP
jgi:hypothetical protein